MDLSALLSGVKAQEDQSMEKKALPASDYNVVIEKVEAKTNASTGAKGISLQCRVFGEKYNNYVVFDYMAITGSDKALEYSLPKLKKLGMITGTENASTWVGKKVKMSLGIDKNDPTRNINWGFGEVVVDDNTPISSSNIKPTITSDDIPF